MNEKHEYRHRVNCVGADGFGECLENWREDVAKCQENNDGSQVLGNAILHIRGFGDVGEVTNHSEHCTGDENDVWRCPLHVQPDEDYHEEYDDAELTGDAGTHRDSLRGRDVVRANVLAQILEEGAVGEVVRQFALLVEVLAPIAVGRPLQSQCPRHF